MEILPKRPIPADSPSYVFLDKFPLCRAMPQQAKMAMYQISVRQVYKKGETIIDAHRGRAFTYVVLKGSVYLYRVSAETGRRRIFWVSEPGDMLGSVHFWGRPGNGELDDCAEAAEDTLLIALPRAELAKIAEQQKELVVAIGDVLSRRLRYMERKLVESTLLPVEDRLLAEIIRLSKMREQATLGGYYSDIRLTHEQLADLIGVARPTLSKVISSLKRRGYLFTDEEGHFVVPNGSSSSSEAQMGNCPGIAPAVRVVDS
jgi:CRP/FNR family cyclic AMP-dependent transcriptional regulator